MSGLRDQIQAIYDKHGVLTPELVVQEARDRNHPLHPRVFDRPPKEAAESWYLHRAHELITSCKIIYKEADENDVAKTTRAFQAVRTDKGYVYEPSEKVAEDPVLKEIVLRDMEREWKQLYRRYSAFEEFATMVSEDLVGAS